jgi:predicted 3-demethylubiquinone-9 3-methyltransferase (glyoxalase superfamily)
MKNIATCLWFDDRAEEAAELYTSIFKNSKIKHTSRYGEAGKEIHQRPVGSVMAVIFELDGREFTALNGGPMFKFTEAISLQVMCESQDEVDYYWEKLGQGGDPKSQQCGWLKDKFGLSWQVYPTVMAEIMSGPDFEKSQRVLAAVMEMKKLDIPTILKAADGN